MERRYKMYCMNNKEYTIDEEDLQKLTLNSDKMLVKLKQVIVHPSSVSAIEPFWVQGVPKAVASDTGMTKVIEPPKPLEDLFMETTLKLNP